MYFHHLSELMDPATVFVLGSRSGSVEGMET